MTLGRMLTLPLWVALDLVRIVAIPVVPVALLWWLAPAGWALLGTLVALFYLYCVRWAARAAHGGLVRMVAVRAVHRSEMRASARELRRAHAEVDAQAEGVAVVTGEVRA
ncbi:MULTISPECIES: hypothetical protein [Actinosynnema]|uniref:hypothetical protein n=1 Tax=Actinosynnema TaxID=40566 RepID=UPI0020A4EB1B|nr:hypothetical protein [Actinosynnema pretiosum]MCP2093350.1 hypothetical protein [Actinosynnema pretiosum]